MVHHNKKYAELNMHTAHNRRVSGSLHCARSAQIPSLRSGTSDTRRALGGMQA